MSLIDDLLKRREVLQQRIHTMQNWPGRLHRKDREELERNIKALKGLNEAIDKLTIAEVSHEKAS